jgi:hypothetical protein
VRRKRSVRWTRTWSNRWATRRSLLLTWRRRNAAVAPVTARGWRMTTHGCDLWECSSCTESRMTTFFGNKTHIWQLLLTEPNKQILSGHASSLLFFQNHIYSYLTLYQSKKYISDTIYNTNSSVFRYLFFLFFIVN